MIFPSEVVQALLYSILRPDKTHTFPVRNSVIEADTALILFIYLPIFIIYLISQTTLPLKPPFFFHKCTLWNLFSKEML